MQVAGVQDLDARAAGDRDVPTVGRGGHGGLDLGVPGDLGQIDPRFDRTGRQVDAHHAPDTGDECGGPVGGGGDPVGPPRQLNVMADRPGGHVDDLQAGRILRPGDRPAQQGPPVGGEARGEVVGLFPGLVGLGVGPGDQVGGVQVEHAHLGGDPVGVGRPHRGPAPVGRDLAGGHRQRQLADHGQAAVPAQVPGDQVTVASRGPRGGAVGAGDDPHDRAGVPPGEGLAHLPGADVGHDHLPAHGAEHHRLAIGQERRPAQVAVERDLHRAGVGGVEVDQEDRSGLGCGTAAGLGRQPASVGTDRAAITDVT